MEVVVATNNKFKLNEIKSIFNEDKIYTLKEKGINIDIEEDCDTFLRNAKKKAHEVYNLVNMPTIADDSGLCINALNGFPGVMTHRFLGEETTDKERNQADIVQGKGSDNAADNHLQTIRGIGRASICGGPNYHKDDQGAVGKMYRTHNFTYERGCRTA